MATAKKTTAKKKQAKRAYTRRNPHFDLVMRLSEEEDKMINGDPSEPPAPTSSIQAEQKHAHYFRDISHMDKIDVYRITDLFDIADHALGHALKKIIVAGGRGAGKTSDQDVQGAIDSLVRWQEMQAENALKVG